MSARVINGVEGLKAAVGEHLGYSDYMEITQERVNQFADAISCAGVAPAQESKARRAREEACKDRGGVRSTGQIHCRRAG